MNTSKTFITLAGVFIASLGLTLTFHFFPVGVVGDLAGVPAVVALFGALFQLSRDRIAFERSIRLEEAKNRFTVGAMSHMAEVAFDKHVSFSEEYTTRAFHVMTVLFQKGPHEDALTQANALTEIRTKWTLWLTPEITTKLGEFESAIRKIGANAWLLKELAGEVPVEAANDRTNAMKEAYTTFAEVMGFPLWDGKILTNDKTVETVVEKLRTALGIGKLTELRAELIQRASETLE